MMSAVDVPAEWDALCGAGHVFELFCYGRSGRVRRYELRGTGAGAQLWVRPARGQRSRGLATFTGAVDVAPFVESVEHELRQGGWVELDRAELRHAMAGSVRR